MDDLGHRASEDDDQRHDLSDGFRRDIEVGGQFFQQSPLRGGHNVTQSGRVSLAIGGALKVKRATDGVLYQVDFILVQGPCWVFG